MNIQDKVVVRTAADLEKKYNFNQMKSNQEVYDKSLIKVENELTNMLNSLIINLKDVLDNQSSISLYFYEGIPTTTNAPYTTWTAATEHIGDLYYDQLSGYIYKYTETGWTQLNDLNLQSALALTNAELDVSTDHERQVFFSQPTPPYQSGDWWILEDGTLKICQLGKTSGSYETNDFIVSSKYTTTVATKQNDTITVLKGTVTEITENYVKYTDLSTGGSTTIAGDNIKTGSIKSNNYVEGVSGTSFNLQDGEIKTENVTLDNEGLKLSNGAKVVGNNGLMNTYTYEVEDFLGYEYDYVGSTDHKKNTPLYINVIIPQGLNVTNATIQLIHTPMAWVQDDDSIQLGRSENIKLAKANNLYSRLVSAVMNSGVFVEDTKTTYTEITGAFGEGGWTPPTMPTYTSETNYNAPTETTTSSDISSAFKNGNNTIPGLYRFKIYNPDATQSWTRIQTCQHSGYIYALLKIDGYMTYN